ERHPQAQRDGYRHFFQHQVDDRDVAIVAVAEIEAQIVPQHHAEALERWLVEAELPFDALDQLRWQALAAAIDPGAELAPLRRLARQVASAAARYTLHDRGILSREIGERLLHRTAGGKLGDEERDGHDAEHGRAHQQQAAKN